jgi:hypothetical protein
MAFAATGDVRDERDFAVVRIVFTAGDWVRRGLDGADGLVGRRGLVAERDRPAERALTGGRRRAAAGRRADRFAATLLDFLVRVGRLAAVRFFEGAFFFAMPDTPARLLTWFPN